MATYRIMGGHLVSEEEFARKGRELSQLAAAPARARLAGVTLDNFAELTVKSIRATAHPKAVEFPAVGYGKPMTIDIRNVYTGRVGSKPFLSGTGDIAVVSGVKSWGEFKASARSRMAPGSSPTRRLSRLARSSRASRSSPRRRTRTCST